MFKAVQKENDTRYGISREEEARRSSEENLAWFPTDDDDAYQRTTAALGSLEKDVEMVPVPRPWEEPGAKRRRFWTGVKTWWNGGE